MDNKAAVAQSVERMALNHVVAGSSPAGGFCYSISSLHLLSYLRA